MVVQGNDRILWIKRGENFQPVGCLTSNGMDEDTEMLATSTRNSEGWRTAIPQMQGYTINFEGLQIPSLFRADGDNSLQTTLTLTIQSMTLFFLELKVESVLGWFLFISKSITSNPGLVADNPASFVLRGADEEETASNLATNLNTYNATSAVQYSAVGANVVLDFASNNQLTVTIFNLIFFPGDPLPLTYVLEETVIPNPNPILSYDRMRLLKRIREKITWRIMSVSPLPDYIDEGEGYITAIGEVSGVNQDATFSGTITGWGVPRVILNNFALGTDGDLIVTDGELITP